MMSSPFSRQEINEHVQRVEEKPGHSFDASAELEPGQVKPTATIEYQGEHVGDKVTVGWGAWAKTQFQKGTRAAGAKLGFKWALAALLLATPAAAQTMPPPATYYEIGIFRVAQSLTTPFSTTRITPEMLSCGRLKREDLPDNAPNPVFFAWDDPNDPTKDCLVEAPTIALTLPLGVGYKAAVRAVSDVGGVVTPSAWSFQQLTFRRAPRGIPCPGGAPGVLVRGEADLNGKPVQISLCVNQ